MFKKLSPLSFFLIFLLLSSCDRFKIPKNVFDRSEREKYERSFAGSDSILIEWKNNYQSASMSRLQISDGSVFQILNDSLGTNAVGYSLDLKKGDRLMLENNIPDTSKKIFIDIYPENSSAENVKSELFTTGIFSKVAEQNGIHKIIIQPEIGFNEDFQVKIYTQPSIGFPVAGKGNRDVQSLWGASRDGGGRSHEGVDIFASRGTPVIAVADGIISRVGNQGLGGKQVWQRDGIFGNSYYYAHLDSILTKSGKSVKTGDTLGTVGNTGNAAGGATHLHFGIYSSGGATDPYPFLKKRSAPEFLKNTKSVEKNYVKTGTQMRSAASGKAEVLKTVQEKSQVKILAVFKNWFHVKLSDGSESFVSSDRLQ